MCKKEENIKVGIKYYFSLFVLRFSQRLLMWPFFFLRLRLRGLGASATRTLNNNVSVCVFVKQKYRASKNDNGCWSVSAQ